MDAKDKATKSFYKLTNMGRFHLMELLKTELNKNPDLSLEALTSLVERHGLRNSSGGTIPLPWIRKYVRELVAGDNIKLPPAQSKLPLGERLPATCVAILRDQHLSDRQKVQMLAGYAGL